MTTASSAPIIYSCLICTTELTPGTWIWGEQLPCGHVHCRPCLRAGLKAAMLNTPFLPVRCCSRIDITVLRRVVPSTELQPYRRRLSEYDSKVKLYCWDSKCGAFIPPALRASVGRAATCRQCHTKTCMDCSSRFHFGLCENPIMVAKNSNDLAFRVLCNKMAWKPCPECKRVTSKTEGCNHIVCICGCHWCYRCGKAPYGNHGECAM